MIRSLFCTLTTALLPLGMSTALMADSAFRNIGQVAPLSESRGSLMTTDEKGDPIFLALLRDVIEGKGARTSLLITHLPSGKTEQYFFPSPEVSNANSYCLFVSRAKRFYLSTDKHFFEFDLASRKILKAFDHLEGPAMSMDEDAKGNIYYAIFPTTELYRYSPETQELKLCTRLDEVQKYPSSMGICEEGWVYTGIGTVRPLLIGWNPATGERVDFSGKADRGTGAGTVTVTLDGKVYGRPYLSSGPWLRLKGGKAEPAPDFTPPDYPERRASLYWLRQRHSLPDGTMVTHFSLRERKLRWKRGDEAEKEITFNYTTEGADISSMALAANGKLYGNTSHPNELWEYDPAANAIRQIGHDPRIGGGNITKLLPWADGVVGNSYSKGDLYFYTPAKPFAPEEAAADQNPALLTNSAPWVSRPRGLMLHPDGEHLLSSGYPGYGRVGGGLLIYNIERMQKMDVMPAEDLIPGQAISSMAASPDGRTIYFSSSTATPGGGTTKAKEAVIAAFSWETRKVLWTQPPVEGATFLTAITLIDPEHLAGITSSGVFYVVYLPSRKTIRTQDLKVAPAGQRGDGSFVTLADGKGTLLLMQNAIYRIKPKQFQLEKVADTPAPVSNVGPLVGRDLYFSSAGNLWRYTLPTSLTPTAP